MVYLLEECRSEAPRYVSLGHAPKWLHDELKSLPAHCGGVGGGVGVGGGGGVGVGVGGVGGVGGGVGVGGGGGGGVGVGGGVGGGVVSGVRVGGGGSVGVGVGGGVGGDGDRSSLSAWDLGFLLRGASTPAIQIHQPTQRGGARAVALICAGGGRTQPLGLYKIFD